MRTDVKELLVNQSTWQRSRKSRSWGEKIREVERVRESLDAYKYRTDQAVKRALHARLTGRAITDCFGQGSAKRSA